MIINLIKNFVTRKLIKKEEKKTKGIFIDCGGFDGCSSIKFILKNPHFDSISFEPNPKLWPYFTCVPTTLIKKGVSSKNEKRIFFLDNVDGDGSSIIPEKNVIFGKKDKNLNCSKITIDCISVPNLVLKLSENYSHIILKLDVEGAEYDILEELIAQNIIKKITKVYVEFHWQKCNFSKDRHRNLLLRLRKLTRLAGWDGSDFAIHKQGNARTIWRNQLVAKNISNVGKYQNLILPI
jgi:FkbM family methyltransferase